jgi:hypothetical protein
MKYQNQLVDDINKKGRDTHEKGPETGIISH